MTGSSPTRRALLQTAMAAGAPAMLRSQNSRKPNLLFLLSDDHSVPYVNCYGVQQMRTPNLDRFASEGMRFNKAFTAAPQCVPSRAALMTGRSAVSVRMTRFSSPLPPDVVSLPELLRDGGYHTGVCGRYFHLDGVAVAGERTRAIYDKYGLKTWQRRIDYLDTSAQTLTNQKFEEFLGRAPSGKPFFFWANFSDPHHVWDRDVANPHDPARIKLPPHLPDLPGVRSDLGRYFDEVARLDGLVQNVLDVLKKRGELDNTLIVFMGDNGMAFPHGKGSLYDPGLNVPLFARWPGRIKAGGVTDSLISGEDIAPTFLDAAGLKPHRDMTGRSFLPLLTGGSYEPRRHVFAERGFHGNGTFTEQTRADTWDSSRCARSDRYKLIYNCTPWMEYWPVDSSKDPGWVEMVAAHQSGKLRPDHERAYFTRPRPVWELYDLTVDPSELSNLAGRPELATVEDELRLALHEKMIQDYDYLPLPIPEARPAQRPPA